jgi:protein-disulfide isomerase
MKMNGFDRKQANPRHLVPGVMALVLALGAWMPACSAQDSAAQMKAGKDKDAAMDSSRVLAKVGDRTITAGEVQEKSASDFEQLDLRLVQCQAEYEKSKHAALEANLKRMVQDSLVEKEAAAKNMTKETYLAAEMKAPEITDAAIDAFYEENKARIPPTTTKEQIAPQIRQYLQQQGQAEAQQKFMSALEAKHKVQYMIEPMRVQVAATGPAKGPENAPVTIVEFSDFECPFCSRLVPTMDEVTAKYGDKVRLVFRQFPLAMHQNAKKAAEASLCANDQGKFWEMHDAMFKNQQGLAVDALKAKAVELGLNAEAFNSCLDSGKHAGRVNADLKDGSVAGVSGTPAMFINGRFVSGAVPFSEVAKIIDEELQKKGAGTGTK